MPTPSPASLIPVVNIDLAQFRADPYPTVARLRRDTPVAHVPQLDATLITRHADITRCEKLVTVFSSEQPGGLMTTLMGQNLMRKDGRAHLIERHAIMPALSARTTGSHWRKLLQPHVTATLAELQPRGKADLVADFAMPVAVLTLKEVTGLTTMRTRDMNTWSQAMIDGIANYACDPVVEADCHAATAGIDACITERFGDVAPGHDPSLLGVMRRSGMPEEAIRANIKLAISGGQNESRDAIAGAAWAILAHPEQRSLVDRGAAGWEQVFDEFVRWISPIGMSPRRIAKPFALHDITLAAQSRAFLMFGAANRDETIFQHPDRFDILRDTRQHVAFGAGPHFCAGAAVSRLLVAGLALPALFDTLPGLRLASGHQVRFEGWAFRGPVSVPVEWDT